MKLKNILGFLYAIYLIMSQIMTVVFFIQYCRTDSLLEIIFIDSFLSDGKNGADCYSKNGHAVTVLTRQS